VFGIASGQAVTEVMYNTVRDRLPAEAQQGMDYARRVINGENIPQMILTQAEQVVADNVRVEAGFILEAAKSQGAAAMSAAQSRVDAMYNQYAAEFGYQMALDMLPSEARGWLQLGLVGGAAIRPEQPQIEERFATVPESNRGENDLYIMKGENLIASGIRYNVMPVSNILKGSKFSITIDYYDLLDEVWTKRLMSYDITDAWRRGFTIAIAVCEGSSERGPGQLAVYHTLAEVGGRAGFDAGQAVQFNRTLSGDSGLFKTTIAKADQPSDADPLSRLPVLTTSMTHLWSLVRTWTSYSWPGPACCTTFAQASLSARAMSARVSGVTPRVSRQLLRTWRQIGTLTASRGR